MVSFKPSPPAATFLAFNPQDNNIIAMGMEDSTIQIYNVNTGEVFSVNWDSSFVWNLVVIFNSR
jgi:WD40 repeat protein